MSIAVCTSVELTSTETVNGLRFTPKDHNDQIRNSPQSAAIHGSRALVWLLERNMFAGVEGEWGVVKDATIPFEQFEASRSVRSRRRKLEEKEEM